MPTEITQPIVVRETAGMGRLKWRDALLGLIVAMGGGVGDIIYASIKAWADTRFDMSQFNVVFDWDSILRTALLAGVSYIGKNFFTGKKTITFAPKEEVKIVEKSTGDTLVADVGKVK